MNSRSLRFATIVTTILACGAADVAAADWTWDVTPYLWATDVGVDASIADRQVLDTTIPVNDLIDDLDTTFQVHVEGQRRAHGLFLDLFDVRLSTDAETFEVPSIPGAAVVLDSRMAMTVFEAGGVYDPKGDRKGFALLYGTRIFDQSAEINALLGSGRGENVVQTFDDGDTLVDGLIGARYVARFGRGWSTAIRADVSTGGTRFTWSTTSAISYAFGKTDRYAITTGYRRMTVDFKDQNALQVDMTLSGLFAGFRFSF